MSKFLIIFTICLLVAVASEETDYQEGSDASEDASNQENTDNPEKASSSEETDKPEEATNPKETDSNRADGSYSQEINIPPGLSASSSKEGQEPLRNSKFRKIEHPKHSLKDHPREKGEYKQKIRTAAMRCLTNDPGLSGQRDCLSTCIMRELNMLDDKGNFLRDGVLENIRLQSYRDTETIQRQIRVFDVCSKKLKYKIQKCAAFKIYLKCSAGESKWKSN